MDFPLYMKLAQLIEARQNCERSDNKEWFDRHTESIHAIMRSTAPSGSGIDNGTEIDLDWSSPECLVFYTSFHHMDEGGSYDGWTEHTVRVYPSLTSRFRLSITGRNRNDIKEYLHDVFHNWLSTEMAYGSDETLAAQA